MLSSTTPRRRLSWLPNGITLLRIALGLALPLLFMTARPEAEGPRWAAAVLFLLIMGTDGIDGALARRYGWVTRLGQILDPLADKVVTGAALITLTAVGELPLWVLLLVLLREWGITLLRLLPGSPLSGERVAAKWWGKAKTVAQVVAITLALVPLSPQLPALEIINTVIMSLATAITLLSGALYFWPTRKLN